MQIISRVLGNFAINTKCCLLRMKCKLVVVVVIVVVFVIVALLLPFIIAVLLLLLLLGLCRTGAMIGNIYFDSTIDFVIVVVVVQI